MNTSSFSGIGSAGPSYGGNTHIHTLDNSNAHGYRNRPSNPF